MENVVVKSLVVPQRPCKVGGIVYTILDICIALCMQDETVAIGDMNQRTGRYSGKSF